RRDFTSRSPTACPHPNTRVSSARSVHCWQPCGGSARPSRRWWRRPSNSSWKGCISTRSSTRTCRRATPPTGPRAMRIRYSRWDGTQRIDDLDADDLLDAMADDLTADGDIWNALRRLFQRGMHDPHGPQMPGLQDLLQQLRKRRQQQLDRYDLGSALEDIKKKLEQVVKTEREGVRRMPQGQERSQHERQLDQLPHNPAGQIKQLQDYDFVDPEAERQFKELLQSLQQQMLQPFLSGMKQALGGMSPQDLEGMRGVLRDLNRMLRDKLQGDEPDFQSFKDKWGDHFPGVESFDQLMEQIGRQMAQMQSMLQSMSPEQ